MLRILHGIITALQGWLKLDGACVCACVCCEREREQVHTPVPIWICLDCVSTVSGFFIRWETSYLSHPPPWPHINYIRPVIYEQITGCKTHYFLMERGLRRDQSARIMVGLGLTTSCMSIQLHYRGGICPPAHLLNAAPSSLGNAADL